MSHLTFFTALNDRIDIVTQLFGKKSIYYNGELVSRVRSVFGSNHTFEVSEQGKSVRYIIVSALRFPFRTGVDIYRNGFAVLLS